MYYDFFYSAGGFTLIIRGKPSKSFKNGTVEVGRGLFGDVKLRLGTPEKFSTGENRAGS